MAPTQQRTIGLLGATAIGVGAIVGGGILALSGVAFALTGPSAVLAFALNGVIALITALSFAELATAFPQSGGTYAFAKRVLSVHSAFSIGWVVWFASIVAAALYAAGFAAFLLEGINAVVPETGWLKAAWVLPATAILSSALCAVIVMRSSGGSGLFMNALKVIVFLVLIVGGCIVFIGSEHSANEQLRPFMPGGVLGLVQAMGATFIALQGFDLIAAVAGEVKEPQHNLPRSMLYALAIALLVYLPLLLIVPLVGVAPGASIQAEAALAPDTIIASAVGNYLGTFGFWLVIVAGILSMASALLANIFAAARIAQAMARDRTLAVSMERSHERFHTPHIAIFVTAGITACILLAVGDVAAAGSASSLIFLLAFTLTHLLCIITRKRKPQHSGFRIPWWPYLPALGAILCFSLAVYQAISVPSAGIVTLIWLGIGAFAYAWLFGHRAKIFDAANEASDPDLLLLRGRSPLVLAPIANPGNARLMASVAGCISAPKVGRVLLLNVVRPPSDSDNLDDALNDTAQVLRDSMSVALHAGVRCESLATVASDPWFEIQRVAHAHRCASLLIGVKELDSDMMIQNINTLMREVEANLLLIRAKPDWDPAHISSVLIPIGGRSVHVALRARLLASLDRRSESGIKITYLIVDDNLHTETSKIRRKTYHGKFIGDETNLEYDMKIINNPDVGAAICQTAKSHDLLVLGLGNIKQGKPAVNPMLQRILNETDQAVIMLSAHD